MTPTPETPDVHARLISEWFESWDGPCPDVLYEAWLEARIDELEKGRKPLIASGYDTGLRDGLTEEEAEKLADEGSPEYITLCPACGCRFGVN